MPSLFTFLTPITYLQPNNRILSFILSSSTPLINLISFNNPWNYVYSDGDTWNRHIFGANLVLNIDDNRLFIHSFQFTITPLETDTNWFPLIL